MGLFRRLFGSKRKTKSTSTPSNNSTPSLSSKYHDNASTLSGPIDAGSDANRHAVAVAAATAAVAEAALAAAKAAAEVVRLTNAGSSGGGDGRYGAASSAHVARGYRQWLQELSAIRIQSAFRSYLARRALRALKALVKLQALVRGHIVRKKTADMLRRMQTLVRLQARARASRTRMSESWHSVGKASYSRHARCGSSANSSYFIDRDRTKSGRTWLDHWMEESLWNNQLNSPLKNRHTDDEKGDKILEVDTWMPRVISHQGNRGIPMSQHVLASDSNSQSFLGFDSPSKPPRKMPSVHSGEVLPLNSVKLPLGDDETFSGTADNSPHMNSAASRPGSSSRKGPFTPTRSECSWGFLNGYSGYPSYMANTESSRAKARSQSAPRQRLEFNKYGLMNRSTPDTHSEIGFSQPTQFRNKVDKALGYLKRRLESGT